MNEFPRWKYVLVVVALILGVLYALPNIYPKEPAVQVSPGRGVVIDTALKEKTQGLLETQKIAFKSIEIEGERLLIRLSSGEQQTLAADALRDGLGDKYTVALNLASTVPHWLNVIYAKSMPLGLDLQGGVHFLMEVDQKAVLEAKEIQYVEEIRAIAKDKKIPGINASRSAQGGLSVITRSADNRDQLAAEIRRLLPELLVSNAAATGEAFALGVRISETKLREIATETIRQNVATLRSRISALGEPVITQQGTSRIVVELPGVQDTAQAKILLGATASLEWHAVDQSIDPNVAVSSGNIPPDSRIVLWRDTNAPVLIKKKIIVQGDDLVSAAAIPDQQSGTPAVSMKLNPKGGQRMLDFTIQSVGKPMAVLYTEHIPELKIVDGKEVRSSRVKEEVISVANIQGVFGPQFQTTGLGSMKEASQLAMLLSAGSLAAPMQIVEERVIGPSLGADNIGKGVWAVILAVILVVLFVGLYYKLFGLIADVGLLLNLVLLVAILSIFGATLTLPGIAGIVLTLGMAIDANVLICERIREELRNGSTPMAAISRGYDRAWATILDANVTHLIAAFGLMAFGSGAIKGFAITLAIGIVTSMFTSVMVTHVLVGLVFGNRRVKSLSV
ncbi:preprotein translocase subunit SecD [Tahibacter aquaticus]|uniref:Protein translocase subunit SecD n=1 Tax=Tahibacter aquaticus TaxID=520092 RepID=A0A4R6ZA12_9GAMM|nr:protein translocase subunit SecD [Tahibacter aquaticus]TDR48509.1 preprotein translocase subunit SecD [Tahibacter aquaticus]